MMVEREKRFADTGILEPVVVTDSKVVLTLHMCDMIEEESLSRRKTIYTLKNVA